MENNELSDFGIILLFIIGGLVFVLLLLAFSKLIRPDRPNAEKLSSYECGEDAEGNSWAQFNTRFYIIALIFLLFEVEMVFLFPWATVFGNAALIEETDGLWGWFSLVEGFIFMVVLILGLAYAWAKGFLDWLKPRPEKNQYQSGIPGHLYEKINKKYEGEKSSLYQQVK